MCSLEISARHASRIIAEDSTNSNWPSTANVNNSSARPPGRRKALTRRAVSKTTYLIVCASPALQAFRRRGYRQSTVLLPRRSAAARGRHNRRRLARRGGFSDRPCAERRGERFSRIPSTTSSASSESSSAVVKASRNPSGDVSWLPWIDTFGMRCSCLFISTRKLSASARLSSGVAIPVGYLAAAFIGSRIIPSSYSV
jgi:hypothetical protein